MKKILKKYWGYDSFRPAQEEIINSVCSGRDTLGLLPTGGGKSITFQVPAMTMEGLTIVVTPLIALMKDQVDNLKARHIPAVHLHSGMSFREMRMARERLFNGGAKFLYVSPERLGNKAFLSEISRLKVNLIAIDEAHCISQWGYDFRPSYLKIKNLRKVFPDVPVLALTASATPDVVKDICAQLDFRPGYNIFSISFGRENISYLVRQPQSKLNEIYHILSRTSGTSIVYVRSRKKTREIAEYLTNCGISATFYHAGLSSEIKEERQNAWKTDAVRVMVATNAFGMGIDKPDVRVVIHYDFPPSIEEYYQEAGRAGRDGLPSFAVLLRAPSDKAILRRRVTMEFPERDVIRRIYTRCCVFSHLEIGEGYDRTVEFDIDKFCRTYHLQETTVRPSLRILSQAGYLDFIEELENSSRLMVTVDREELYRVKFDTPVLDKILTVILRKYPGIFTDYIYINENSVAYLAAVDNQDVYDALIQLSKLKILHYIPRRKTPILYFPTSMEEEKYIEIGKEVYEHRKAILSARIEAMIDFAYSEDGCRVAKMLAYFGEAEAEDCRCCDCCREKRKQPENNLRLSNDEISRQLVQLLKSNPEGLEQQVLNTYFGLRHSVKAIELLRMLAADGIVKAKDGRYILS